MIKFLPCSADSYWQTNWLFRGRRHLEDNFQCHSVRILSCPSLFPLFLCFIISHYGALNIVLQNDATQVGYKGGGRRRCNDPKSSVIPIQQYNFSFFGGKGGEAERKEATFFSHLRWAFCCISCVVFFLSPSIAVCDVVQNAGMKLYRLKSSFMWLHGFIHTDYRWTRFQEKKNFTHEWLGLPTHVPDVLVLWDGRHKVLSYPVNLRFDHFSSLYRDFWFVETFMRRQAQWQFKWAVLMVSPFKALYTSSEQSSS